MPLGGYCSVCERWVWLTPYGECQNGHPASAVRDVQQLKPQAESIALVEAATPSARQGSLSLLVAALAVDRLDAHRGFINWVAFLYIGARARHAVDALGFVYLLPLVLTWSPSARRCCRPFRACSCSSRRRALPHALYLRPYYRAIMFGDMPPRRLPAPPQPPSLLRPSTAGAAAQGHR